MWPLLRTASGHAEDLRTTAGVALAAPGAQGLAGGAAGRTAGHQPAYRAPGRRPSTRARLPHRGDQGSRRRLQTRSGRGPAPVVVRRRAGCRPGRRAPDRRRVRSRHRGSRGTGAEHRTAGHVRSAAPPDRHPPDHHRRAAGEPDGPAGRQRCDHGAQRRRARPPGAVLRLLAAEGRGPQTAGAGSAPRAQGARYRVRAGDRLGGDAGLGAPRARRPIAPISHRRIARRCDTKPAPLHQRQYIDHSQ